MGAMTTLYVGIPHAVVNTEGILVPESTVDFPIGPAYMSSPAQAASPWPFARPACVSLADRVPRLRSSFFWGRKTN